MQRKNCGRHNDQQGYRNGQKRELHTDPQHEQHISAGEDKAHQPAFHQGLDFESELFKGAKSQLQVANAAHPKELRGQIEQPVHACKLCFCCAGVLGEEDVATLNPLERHTGDAGGDQHEADLEQKAEIPVRQGAVGDDGIECWRQHGQPRANSHHGNSTSKAAAHQPEAGPENSSGGSKAEDPS